MSEELIYNSLKTLYEEKPEWLDVLLESKQEEVEELICRVKGLSTSSRQKRKRYKRFADFVANQMAEDFANRVEETIK
jgi:hypothetical protein